MEYRPPKRRRTSWWFPSRSQQQGRSTSPFLRFGQAFSLVPFAPREEAQRRPEQTLRGRSLTEERRWNALVFGHLKGSGGPRAGEVRRGVEGEGLPEQSRMSGSLHGLFSNAQRVCSLHFLKLFRCKKKRESEREERFLSSFSNFQLKKKRLPEFPWILGDLGRMEEKEHCAFYIPKKKRFCNLRPHEGLILFKFYIRRIGLLRQPQAVFW